MVELVAIAAGTTVSALSITLAVFAIVCRLRGEPMLLRPLDAEARV